MRDIAERRVLFLFKKMPNLDISTLDDNQKNKLFCTSDIFVFPSIKEGFGLVVAEAMACGLPVVASDNTSLPEVIINGQTGYLAKTSDVNDWVKKIEILVKNPKKRENMAINSVKVIRDKFSWEKVADKTINVYEMLLR